MVVYNGTCSADISNSKRLYRKDSDSIYDNGGWPGHVIKDMEENCKGAAFAHEMQIQFDSKGKDHLETSEEVITEWIGQINTDINK